MRPAITAATQVLAHVPVLVEHGSKPRREIAAHPEVAHAIAAARRGFEDAVAYPPHQAYLGAIHPRDLPERPWWSRGDDSASRFGPFGEIMPEPEFLGLLAAVDRFELVTLAPEAAVRAAHALASHPLAKRFDLERVESAAGDAEKAAAEPGALTLRAPGGEVLAAVASAHGQDEALTGSVLTDNLAAKATATLALCHLLDKSGIDPASIDYVISCGEEAIGDRYQRGGGNLAKAVAEEAGLTEASGADVKDFCAAPIPALVMASALVAAGVFERVAVVAGGSVAKLGMKFQGHLRHDMPVLEDVLGGTATLIEAGGDGARPALGVVGRHRVAAGGSSPQIMEALTVEPLSAAGIAMTEIDDYATELHNPELTEPQGSGNVPERNYKTIAALAVRKGDLARADIADFITTRGMPGYAPTQGHIASALCYLPHAVARLRSGEASRAMLIAKGSLFLGRMSQLSDGMSVLLHRADE